MRAKRTTRRTVKKRPARAKKPVRPHKRAAPRTRPAVRRKAKERATARAKLAQRLIAVPHIEEHKPIPKYPLLPGADSERARMITPLLKDAVRKRLITDWRINLAHTKGANLYLGQDLSLENDQRTEREDVIVTVYRRFDDGTMGEAQVPIIAADPATARGDIARAADLAYVARKTAFDLPEPAEELKFPQGYDTHLLGAFISGEGHRVPRQVLDDLRAHLAQIKDVKLAMAEILSSATTARVVNSRGVDVSFHRTALYLDLTLTCKGKIDEQEFHWTIDVVSPEQLNLRATVPRMAQRARDALAATANGGFTGNVLLSGEALRDYITPNGSHNPLVLHAHARLKAMGISRLSSCEPIGEFKGEPFTLSSNPALPLGALSMPVDEEGTPLAQLDIVRTGVFLQWIAGPRYARELGVPVTGNVANVQVSAGATREEHLRGNRYAEIVTFSWFNPDPVSGDYSAEIRLGYFWENGRATPFRGGHLVGNVFSDLCDARFSREVMQAGRYYGPRAVLLRNGSIARSG